MMIETCRLHFDDSCLGLISCIVKPLPLPYEIHYVTLLLLHRIDHQVLLYYKRKESTSNVLLFGAGGGARGLRCHPHSNGAYVFFFYRAMGEDMRHRRVNEAYSLMTDILASKPVVQPTPSIYSAARPISPKAAAKEQAEKEKEKRRKRERQLTYAPRVAPVSADTVNFKYSLSKKKYKGGRSGFGSEAKSPGSKHAVSASDAMKSAKKVQFSSTQGMLKISEQSPHQQEIRTT